ncbi:MAG: MotA/TolQ/ExbB proton channel family protein [Betaproteobacteria bacterium]|nr:MotA/TolQ/ExbB proton channel family protein [Betaproteobacteria bacterium]
MMNWQNLNELATHSGGILYLMPILLLTALTIGIERFLVLARIQRDGERVVESVAPLSHLDHGSLGGLKERTGAPFKAILEVPVRFPRVRDSGKLSELLQEVVMRQVPTLDRRMWLLDTIITLAPLLGLLGTIIGMFHAFQFMGNAAGDAVQITGSVGEALIATAFGLVIAVIGLVAFNGLHNRVRYLVHQMETLRTMLVNRLDGVDHHNGLHASQATAAIYAAQER